MAKLGYVLVYVDQVEETMEFYEKAFDLKRSFLHESSQYGEMATGTTKLGFVQHDTARSHGFSYEKFSPKHIAPGMEIALVVDQVGAAFKRAVAAGAETVSQPAQKPWGQIVSYVRDCNGLLVEICSEM